MDQVTLLLAIFDVFVIGGCIWWLSHRFRSKIAEVEARQAMQAAERAPHLDSPDDAL